MNIAQDARLAVGDVQSFRNLPLRGISLSLKSIGVMAYILDNPELVAASTKEQIINALVEASPIDTTDACRGAVNELIAAGCLVESTQEAA